MGKLGLSDPEQLVFAVQNDWAIVTHNRKHFVALAEEYRRTNRVHCGIIIEPMGIGERQQPELAREAKAPGLAHGTP
jgi:hypothetical protein